MEYWIFGILSFIVTALTLILAVKKTKLSLLISPLQIGTAGVFLASLLLFLPVYYNWQEWGDAYTYIRPVLLSVAGAIRLFFLALEFETVEQTVKSAYPILRAIFCCHAALLFAAAPILTFGNVLFLFKNAFGEVRLLLCRRRPLYILSQLNIPAITLAESIVDSKPKKGRGRPLIVFADVFTQNEEEDYELLQRARNIHAFCLKKDITHIDFPYRKAPVEIFLIDTDAAENMAQAISMTEKYKDSTDDISLYVFSSEASADPILDALDKGNNLLGPDFKAYVTDHPRQILEEGYDDKKHFPLQGNFSIHQVNPVELLVRNVLTRNNYTDYVRIQNAAEQDKTVSILLLGMGSYGSCLLKTAVWFYQRYGYRVEINVFDMGGKNGDAAKRLAQECPELMQTHDEDGDACYDIRFFTGVDCFSSEFEDLVSANWSRFRKTKLAFVAMGQDDGDIRAALSVRSLFDRLFLKEGTASALPLVYSVVYNDQTVASLNAAAGNAPKVQFVGAHAEQYAYSAIEQLKERENAAFRHHLDWVRTESYLRKCYAIAQDGIDHPHAEHCRVFKQDMDAEAAGKPITWGDSYLYEDNDYSKPIIAKLLLDDAAKYMRDSYCRKSSLAKYDHKSALRQLTRFRELSEAEKVKHTSQPAEAPHPIICSCDRCLHQRITEHMRWNAYMRSIGYRFYAKRNRDALTHPDLVTWQALTCRERYKD